MRSLWESGRLFAWGIGKRVFWLFPGAILGAISAYDAFMRPYLPPEWHLPMVTVPLAWVIAAVMAGLLWAAFLTYHELRTRPAPPSSTGGPTFLVQPGATLNYYDESPFGTGISMGSNTSTLLPSLHRTEAWSLVNPNPTLWESPASPKAPRSPRKSKRGRRVPPP